MLRRNNPTQNVLGVSETGLAAVGTTTETLAQGQLGVFSDETGEAIDASAEPQRFFLAVGLGGGEFRPSAGIRGIVDRETFSYEFSCFQSPDSAVIGISEITKVRCETDYSIKLRLSNDSSREHMGFHDVVETFAIRTGCCDADDCENPCKPGENSDLVKRFVEAINAQGEFFEATAYNPADGAFIDDVDAFLAVTGNEDTLLGIAVKALPYEIAKRYGYFDYDYVDFSASNLEAFLGVGFECKGKVETLKEVAYERGTGRQLSQAEWRALGNISSPLRQTMDGIPLNRRLNPITADTIDAGGKYSTVTITNETVDASSDRLYRNTVSTLVAVPCVAGNATVETLLGILNVQLPSKEAKTAAACPSCDPEAPLFIQEASNVQELKTETANKKDVKKDASKTEDKK